MFNPTVGHEGIPNKTDEYLSRRFKDWVRLDLCFLIFYYLFRKNIRAFNFNYIKAFTL